ncbi:hypothetical protein Dsin_017671 [Dipteronia sinensis]|uniref:Uncharacterized protein n=1 Tax=Dipteronia sinensis TaxID=43782 RepID=A0AAE0AGV4_9ROSI|nr:hypothetical protein Dsin_017671 [Dipteronia sinensis]
MTPYCLCLKLLYFFFLLICFLLFFVEKLSVDVSNCWRTNNSRWKNLFSRHSKVVLIKPTMWVPFSISVQIFYMFGGDLGCSGMYDVFPLCYRDVVTYKVAYVTLSQ